MLGPTNKSWIVILRLVLRKVVVDGATGPLGEIDVRYESDLKVILNG